MVWALTAQSGREFQQLTRRHANENSRALFLLLGLTNLGLWHLVVHSGVARVEKVEGSEEIYGERESVSL